MKDSLRKQITLFFFFMSIALVSQAQRVKEISAEYIYVASTEVSVSEAKRIAVERARIQALADEFGTTVSQTNTTHIQNSQDKSSLDFLSIGNSEVKGEWLQDTKEPLFEINFEGNNLIVKVTVWGKAREIISSSIDVDVAILCNGTEQKFESDAFNDGDDLYLYFKSPISGYIAVYLVEESETAYCLLPYSNDSDGQEPIEAGKEYIFFDAKRGETPQEQALIDELTITCNKNLEHNEIIIVFSSQPFVKALDEQVDERLPRSLPYDKFQHWLTRNRIKDSKMTVINKLIKVTK